MTSLPITGADGLSDERALFEAVMNEARFFPAELCFAITKSPSGHDEYANSHLESCWTGWRARAALASRAPVSAPHPGESDSNLPAVAWVTPLRYGSQVTFYKPPKPDGWGDDEEKWYCYPLVRAAGTPAILPRNFCSTCGKRTPPDSIHTCTPLPGANS
jgi:hypothetical protein